VGVNRVMMGGYMVKVATDVYCLSSGGLGLMYVVLVPVVVRVSWNV
jgi:hypothetical protein